MSKRTDTSEHDRANWTVVDRGWGHAAQDFSTLSETANCREYVALHQRLHSKAGDRLLDLACGSGLAAELAQSRGAAPASSNRLVKHVRPGLPFEPRSTSSATSPASPTAPQG